MKIPTAEEEKGCPFRAPRPDVTLQQLTDLYNTIGLLTCPDPKYEIENTAQFAGMFSEFISLLLNAKPAERGPALLAVLVTLVNLAHSSGLSLQAELNHGYAHIESFVNATKDATISELARILGSASTSQGKTQ